MGKSKRIKSLNSGKLIFFLNLKLLLKNLETKNKILSIININNANLDPNNKNLTANPFGIASIIKYMLNSEKNAAK